jgi:hypothetical protein
VKPLLLIAAATLCLASTEPRVSRASIIAVEKSINEEFANKSGDPNAYDVLGNARGTYLEGYGALFTVELDLINTGPLTPNPFKQTITAQEIATTRERKLKKLAMLRESMHTLMVNAAGTLEGLPANERVSMAAVLLFNKWEESRGMPRRLFMSAEKQKLLDAKAAHAGQPELAAIIEEQER